MTRDARRRDNTRRCATTTTLALAAPPAAAQAPEKPKITIGVGGKPLFYYLPLTVAERQGYFKAEGLDVEILDFPGGAPALQALLGGSVDVVSGAYEHTISQQAKGQDIEALVLQGKYAGIVLGMSKAKAAAYKTPADLKGMKIGVTAPGSSTNMFVNILLAKTALKPDAVAQSVERLRATSTRGEAMPGAGICLSRAWDRVGARVLAEGRSPGRARATRGRTGTDQAAGFRRR